MDYAFTAAAPFCLIVEGDSLDGDRDLKRIRSGFDQNFYFTNIRFCMDCKLWPTLRVFRQNYEFD